MVEGAEDVEQLAHGRCCTDDQGAAARWRSVDDGQHGVNASGVQERQGTTVERQLAGLVTAGNATTGSAEAVAHGDVQFSDQREDQAAADVTDREGEGRRLREAVLRRW
jgi:hypothetical protein